MTTLQESELKIPLQTGIEFALHTTENYRKNVSGCQDAEIIITCKNDLYNAITGDLIEWGQLPKNVLLEGSNGKLFKKLSDWLTSNAVFPFTLHALDQNKVRPSGGALNVMTRGGAELKEEKSSYYSMIFGSSKDKMATIQEVTVMEENTPEPVESSDHHEKEDHMELLCGLIEWINAETEVINKLQSEGKGWLGERSADASTEPLVHCFWDMIRSDLPHMQAHYVRALGDIFTLISYRAKHTQDRGQN